MDNLQGMQFHNSYFGCFLFNVVGWITTCMWPTELDIVHGCAAVIHTTIAQLSLGEADCTSTACCYVLYFIYLFNIEITLLPVKIIISK